MLHETANRDRMFHETEVQSWALPQQIVCVGIASPYANQGSNRCRFGFPIHDRRASGSYVGVNRFLLRPIRTRPRYLTGLPRLRIRMAGYEARRLCAGDSGRSVRQAQACVSDSVGPVRSTSIRHGSPLDQRSPSNSDISNCRGAKQEERLAYPIADHGG